MYGICVYCLKFQKYFFLKISPKLTLKNKVKALSNVLDDAYKKQ